MHKEAALSADWLWSSTNDEHSLQTATAPKCIDLQRCTAKQGLWPCYDHLRIRSRIQQHVQVQMPYQTCWTECRELQSLILIRLRLKLCSRAVGDVSLFVGSTVRSVTDALLSLHTDDERLPVLERRLLSASIRRAARRGRSCERAWVNAMKALVTSCCQTRRVESDTDLTPQFGFERECRCPLSAAPPHSQIKGGRVAARLQANRPVHALPWIGTSATGRLNVRIRPCASVMCTA